MTSEYTLVATSQTQALMSYLLSDGRQYMYSYIIIVLSSVGRVKHATNRRPLTVVLVPGSVFSCRSSNKTLNEAANAVKLICVM